MNTTILRTWTVKNKKGQSYDVSIRFDMEKHEIVWIDCTCWNFVHRRIKQENTGPATKYPAEPCKHLQKLVDFFEREEGFSLKLPKPMEGPDKCPISLKKALIERSEGLCEMNCGREGINVHRKLRGSQGGKYILDNCILLCNECHKMFHANEFKKVRSK